MSYSVERKEKKERIKEEEKRGGERREEKEREGRRKEGERGGYDQPHLPAWRVNRFFLALKERMWASFHLMTSSKVSLVQTITSPSLISSRQGPAYGSTGATRRSASYWRTFSVREVGAMFVRETKEPFCGGGMRSVCVCREVVVVATH